MAWLRTPSRLVQNPHSGSSFFFQVYIPKDLTHHFDDSKSFRISLQSGTKAHSSRLSRNLSATVDTLFNEIRSGMRSLTIADIKEILRIEIRKSILHANHVHLGTNEFSQKEVIRSQGIQQTRQQNLKHTLEEDLKNYESKIDQTLDEILAGKEIEANKSSVDYKKLKRNFIRIHDLRMQWIQELLSKSSRSDSDFEREAESVVGMHLYDEKQSPAEEPLFATESNPIQKVQEKHESEKSFREIVEEYFRWKELEGTAAGAIYEKRRIIEDFIEVSKVEFSDQVTKEQIRNYIQIESKLPLHRTKNPRFRGKSVDEILLMEDVEGQGVKNINKKISILTTFGNWCEKNGYFEQNNFRGMKFDSKQKRLERENFNEQDLEKILNPQTYLNSTIYGISSITKKPISNREAYYWIFLLGIFSGLRTNEMTQLRLEDFQQVDGGVWMIQVQETEETRVKTRNSIRRVPVHPQLIELGILDYIQRLKKQNKERFFWELKMVRGKYGKEVSRFFNEKYLKEVGVWKQTVKVLYCTRHTLIHNLYRKGVDENVIKTLVGHEKEFTMKHYGGNPYDADQLLREISKIEYPSVDFGSLRVDWKREK